MKSIINFSKGYVPYYRTVYILSNPTMHADIVMIGFARDAMDAGSKIAQFNVQPSTVLPFEIVAALTVDDAMKIHAELHDDFGGARIRNDFFQMHEREARLIVGGAVLMQDGACADCVEQVRTEVDRQMPIKEREYLADLAAKVADDDAASFGEEAAPKIRTQR